MTEWLRVSRREVSAGERGWRLETRPLLMLITFIVAGTQIHVGYY